MPAADPNSMLLMSVICDLQLDVVGVGFLLSFDLSGPPNGLSKPKLISPLFPFDLPIVAFAPAIACDRPRPESSVRKTQ
jgi:hypothetical protein